MGKVISTNHPFYSGDTTVDTTLQNGEKNARICNLSLFEMTFPLMIYWFWPLSYTGTWKWTTRWKTLQWYIHQNFQYNIHTTSMHDWEADGHALHWGGMFHRQLFETPVTNLAHIELMHANLQHEDGSSYLTIIYRLHKQIDHRYIWKFKDQI